MSSLRGIRQGAKYRRAKGRLEKKDSMTVSAWAETSLWATQSYLEEYKRSGDPGAAAFVVDGAIGLLAAGDVLLDRVDKTV